jgi:hypothetical protein
MPDQFDALAKRFGGTETPDQGQPAERSEAPAPQGPKSASIATMGAAAPTHIPDLQGAQPEHWPAAGGALGGMLGAAGGTAFGFGFGGLPGGVAGATLGGGAGEAFKQLYDFFAGREVPETAGARAAEIGKSGAIQGAIEGVGGAAVKGAGAAAQSVYRGYLKPSLSQIGRPKAREIVDTALREALPISKVGEERGGRLIAELNKQVSSLLQNAEGVVDLHQIAEKVRAFAKAKYYKPGVDLEDYRAANEVADLIDKHPALGIPEGANPTRVDVSPVQANEVKQAVRPASRAYGTRGAGPEAATRKEAGHQLRTELEQVEPQIASLNNRERQIIDAVEAVSQAAGREGNRNAFFGVPSLLSAGVGTGFGANQQDPMAGLAAGVATRLALSPAVASRVAILASRFGKVPGTLPATALRLALQVALSEEQPDQTNQGQQPER